MTGYDHPSTQLLQAFDIIYPLLSFHRRNLTCEWVGLVEEHVAAVEGLYGRYPDYGIEFYIAYNFRNYLDPFSFKLDVVLAESLDIDGLSAHIHSPYNCFPVFKLAEELVIDGACDGSKGGDPSRWESLGDDAQTEIMIGMSMGHVNGREVLARLHYFRDDPVAFDSVH